MEDTLSDEDLIARFPGYPVDQDSAAVYRGRLRHELLVHRCDECSLWHEPPRPVCPRCWSTSVTPTEVLGTGTIFMAIFLRQGPPTPGLDYSTPHPVVVVELDDQPGLRFASTIVGAENDEIRIGRRVALEWIERAGTPIPAFRLIGEGADS